MATRRDREQLAADRAALAGNYLFEKRKEISAWAAANLDPALTYTTRADAYAQAHGETEAYEASVDAFRKIEDKYERSSFPFDLGDLLA